MKGCSRCGESRELSEFSPSKQNKDGLASVCKPCRREMGKIYWANNSSRLKLRRAHKRETNGDALREWFRKNSQHQKRTNVQWKLRGILRTRLYQALRRNSRTGHTIELLGCSTLQLKAHLENQFRPGMTWENHGPVWHIDHRRPCASFDFSDPAQQRECFHFTNLQPLFAAENIAKGPRWRLTNSSPAAFLRV